MYFRRLRDLREDRDLKQTDVAALLGIRQTVYSRYERGYQNLPLEHLLALADYYGVSTDYILGRTDNPQTNPEPSIQATLSGGFFVRLIATPVRWC